MMNATPFRDDLSARHPHRNAICRCAGRRAGLRISHQPECGRAASLKTPVPAGRKSGYSRQYLVPRQQDIKTFIFADETVTGKRAIVSNNNRSRPFAFPMATQFVSTTCGPASHYLALPRKPTNFFADVTGRPQRRCNRSSQSGITGRPLRRYKDSCA